MKRILTFFLGTALSLYSITSLHSERLGLDELSRTQRIKLWEMVERAGHFEAVANYCGVRTGLEERIASALRYCITDSAVAAARAHFRHGLNTWSGSLSSIRKKKEFCADAEINEVIRYHRSKSDRQISQVRTMCRVCLAIGRCK